ncbi:MAG: hypothetical protein Q8L27_05085 [archaeon]|nr:hypothetical protein [archaeon]
MVNYSDKIRENPWIVSTIVLAVIVIVFVFSFGITGINASKSEASENFVNFAESQGVDLTVNSIEREGALYKVEADIDGQSSSFYLTTDGKYFISGSVIPLETETNSDTGSDSTSQTNIPKSDKPKVELFVMSYCPYGTQSEKGIIPAIELLGDKIDFELKFVSYAMHDKKEIDENTRQYCIQKEQNSKFLPYMACFLDKGDSNSCLTSTGIDKTKLNTCVASADKEFSITANYNDKSSWSGGRFPKYNVNLEENEQYGVQGSPTLVINGVQSSAGRDAASYLSAICGAFTTKPSECNTDMSSYGTPAPGFGFETQGGSATAAGCVGA